MKGKKPKFQLSLCLWDFHQQGRVLVKGDLLIQGVPLSRRVEREFDLLVCFRKALKSSGFLSNSGKELQKSQKKNPTQPQNLLGF